MTISPADAKDFFRLIENLDDFFESRLHIVKKARLTESGLEEIRSLRSAAFADPAHVRAYAAENPHKLNSTDLETIQAWQDHGFAGRFIVHKHRRGTVFSKVGKETPALYLVQGLTQPIEELVPFFPCYVEARLLPFRGHIITDGIIAPMSVHFGGNMRRNFAAELKDMIATRGVITTLPAGAVTTPDPSALLKYYLSTVVTRTNYDREIRQLCASSPALHVQYLQHMGKYYSRDLKAALKAKGITGGWFAVLEDTVIAGAADRKTAEACAAQLVPAALAEGVVWLKL